jgi:raffinose/stachyose/melibiose transport system permease protein
MSGYAVARHYKESVAMRMLDKLYLASLMIPFQMLMIPVYKIYKTLHLLNSLPGMILMLVGTSIAYASFLYVGFVKSVPREIEESAYIDGCSEFKSFWLITFPLLKPISATVAALHVMWLWNDFNISVILLQKEEVRTITVKQFYFFGQYTADYGMAFAAAILSMIPVVICFILMQKYIVNGIAVGAVKS